MKQSTKVGEILDEISPEIFPVEFKFEFKFPQNPSKLTLLRGSPARLGFGSVGTDQTVGASLGSVQKKRGKATRAKFISGKRTTGTYTNGAKERVIAIMNEVPQGMNGGHRQKN